MSTKVLLEKIEALDTLQTELETMGTELISRPDVKTDSYELKIALAYARLKAALKVPQEIKEEPPKAVFNELEERLQDKEPEPPHEEITR